MVPATQLVFGGCAISVPIPAALAENDDVYAVLCLGGGGGPCPKPSPPTLVAGSARAQGAILNVSQGHPEGDRIYAIWLEALDEGYNRIWEFRSVQGIPAEGLPSDPTKTLRRGTPGLDENSAHYFRVAFENQTGDKTCYSSLSEPVPTTIFSSGLPSLPATLFVKMEDEFYRPETHSANGSPRGDGIGPSEVWTPSDIAEPSYSVSIHSDETSAKVLPGGTIIYEQMVETDHQTFAEVEVRLGLNSGSEDDSYNFEIQARIGEVDLATGLAKAFAVKLAHTLRNCNQPTLLIYRLPEEVNPGCDANQVPLPGGAPCTNTPPLGLEDPNKEGFSHPVHLRIHVHNSASSEPIVEAQAFWNDPDTGELKTCRAAPKTRTFTGDPGGMAILRGKWGAVFHERTYLIDSFRAGDGTAQQP